jgi:hypothetical protein
MPHRNPLGTLVPSGLPNELKSIPECTLRRADPFRLEMARLLHYPGRGRVV